MFHRDNRLSVSQDSVCGAVSGVVARTLTAPLDVTKVLYQVGVPCTKQRAYLCGGLFNLTKHVIKTGGVTAIFRGNGISCMKMFPASAIQFGSYYGFRTLLSDDRGEVSVGCSALAAAGAGYLATVLTYPMNVVKTRMIVKRSAYTGAWDCFRNIRISDGNARVFGGLSAALLSTVPSTISLFVVHEVIERHLSENIPNVFNEGLMEGKAFTHGFLAAFISLLVTHPFDTCKKKMQAYSPSAADHGGVSFRVESFRQCWRHIYARQWIFGLYAGFAPAFLRLVPFQTAMLASYNWCRKLCFRVNGLSSDGEIRHEALIEPELPDLEYLHKEDLKLREPPTVFDMQTYNMEVESIRKKRIKKEKRLEELVDKLFIFKNKGSRELDRKYKTAENRERKTTGENSR